VVHDRRDGSRSGARFEAVAKHGGGVRLIAHLDEVDRRAYGAAVSPLTRRIERSLAPGVFASRARGRGGGAPAAELEPWRPARQRFASAAAILAGRGGTVAVADVRNCYASIRDEVLADRLLRLGASPQEVDRLRGLLERFHDQGIPGLPVGPEPSAILANAVLADADRALARAGVTSLRWVDDIVVFTTSEPAAARALERLAVGLAGAGLEPAAEKTHVLSPEALPEILGIGSLLRPGAHL